MQFFKPENWLLVHEALTAAGRTDLIGEGRECLIKAHPPAAALEGRAQRRGEEFGRFVHERGLLDARRSGRSSRSAGAARPAPGGRGARGRGTGGRADRPDTGGRGGPPPRRSGDSGRDDAE
jgi:hypothetical protein